MSSRLTRRAGPTLVGACLLLGACHTWVTDRQALGRPFPERARVLLWVRGEDHESHGVRVRGDTVYAVPYWRPSGCDSQQAERHTCRCAHHGCRQ